MPYHVGSDESCPAAKPHAVIKDSDGEVMGCHASQGEANSQVAALYANEAVKDIADLDLRLYEEGVKGDKLDATLLLKAATEQITEQGMFTAIAAAYSLDRDGEKIRKGAFANTIKAWSDRDRPIPLHWAHQGDAENVIGHVDPKSMKEIPAGLYVEGHLDLENSEVAREAWRLVKANTVGLSFGFLAEVTPRAKDGTREIVNIDLYEVSITPAPANPDTRFLSLKAVKEPLDRDELRREAAQVERELVEQDLPEPAELEPEPTLKELQAQLLEQGDELRKAQEHQMEMLAVFTGVKEMSDEVRESLSEQERQILDRMQQKQAEETARGRKTRSVDPLLKEAQKAELDRMVGGLDLPKPPVKDPEPEPLDAKRLRKESRDTMLAQLTGVKHVNDTE